MHYHWTNEEGTLRFGDGRKVVVGETLTVEFCTAVCCGRHGLFASPTVRDSLTYAPGARLWGVQLGEIKHDSGDKQGAYSRKALMDFGCQLDNIVQFAAWCSMRVGGSAAANAANAAAHAAANAAANAAYAADADAAANAAANAAYAADVAAANAAANVAAYAAEQQNQDLWWDTTLGLVKWEGC